MKRWTNGLPGATKRLGAKMALRGLAASQPRMRADTHDGPEQIAPLQRPDTLMQLSRSLISEVHLVPHGRAIHFGTKRTCPSRLSLSAFGGKADIASTADIRTGNSSFFPFRYSDLIGAFHTSSAAVFLPEGKSRPRSAVTGGAVRSRTVRSPSECRMMPLFALMRSPPVCHRSVSSIMGAILLSQRVGTPAGA